MTAFQPDSFQPDAHQIGATVPAAPGAFKAVWAVFVTRILGSGKGF
jgi:hypothetical protein